MPTIDQNGLPTIAAYGTLSAEQRAAVINSPAQPEVTWASLIRGWMDVATASIYAVIDPVTRALTAMLESDAAAVAAAADVAPKVAISPDPGQTGRSLTWTVIGEGGVDEALETALGEISAAVKPKISAESVVSRVLSLIPEAMQDKCLVVVDQETGIITVNQFASAAARATAAGTIAAVSLAGKEAIRVTLSEPASGGSAAPLVFEGGSTSL